MSAVESRITGTKEWATSTVNAIEGCSHNCWYCYARSNAARFKRRPADWWHVEKTMFAVSTQRFGKRRGRVMFPSAHDITPANLHACLDVLRRLLRAGNEVLVVSKPHLACVKEICQDEEVRRSPRHLLTFRFTIGSRDDRVLSFWEPGAPSLVVREASLRYAFLNGFNTSVSAEPMLDTEPDLLIERVLGLVTDTLWLGRANSLAARLSLNGAPPEVLEAGRKLMADQSDDWCRDLYERWRHHPKIRFKDSIKRVVGLESPKRAGMDM